MNRQVQPIRPSKELIEELEKIRARYGLGPTNASKVLIEEYRELKEKSTEKERKGNPWSLGINK